MGTRKNVADITKKILILFYKKRLTLLTLCSIIVVYEYISITYIYIFSLYIKVIGNVLALIHLKKGVGKKNEVSDEMRACRECD